MGEYTTIIPMEVLFPWVSNSSSMRARYENEHYSMYGKVMAYYRIGTYLYTIDDYQKQRFIVHVRFSDIPETDLVRERSRDTTGLLPTHGLTLWQLVSSPRFMIYIPFCNITEARLMERFSTTTWSASVGKTRSLGRSLMEAIRRSSPSRWEMWGWAGPTSWYASGPFLNQHLRYSFGSYTLTADLWDCCGGMTLGKMGFAATALPFPCCGLHVGLELSFTKAAGLEKLAFRLGDLSLCCGITAKITEGSSPHP
ncbi:MAG: hypothetical protein ABDI20_01915 [Candidatus Bipolaricaulaceae bacterium]